MTSRIAELLPTFHPASPQAGAISDLFILMLWVAAAIFAIVAGSVMYVVLRYRSHPGQSEPRQTFGHPKLEIAWTLASLLVVTGLFGFTIRTMHTADAPVALQQPDLVVVGHQWWWEVRYPKSGVVTANEIHIPIGQRWLVQLESADVIHDFWVPQLGRKMDMIPGHPNYMWLQPSAPGTYMGTCSEFCGAQHAWMRIRVTADTPDAFAAWQHQQLHVPSAPAGGGEAARGAALFQQLTCVNCHAIAGTLAGGRIAPDLTHLASRETLGAGVLDNTPVNLRAWLTNPQAIKPGSHMPNLQLSDAQVQALGAYLETLQ